MGGSKKVQEIWRCEDAEDIEGRGVLDQVQSTLMFESAERVVGSTGCNRYFAPLQVSDTTLRVGMGGSTRRACPPAVMDQESRFLAALEATRAYRRDGGTLWLLDESGRALVRLTRMDTAAERQEPAEPPPTAGGPQAGPLASYAFDCSGGPGFVITQVDSEAINLALPDGVRRLTRERTASGAQYSDGQITVWNKGQEAALEISGHTYTCVENRARSIREDARARGVEFRGTGNEPGWVLEVLPDRIAFIKRALSGNPSIDRWGGRKGGAAAPHLPTILSVARSITSWVYFL